MGAQRLLSIHGRPWTTRKLQAPPEMIVPLLEYVFKMYK